MSDWPKKEWEAPIDDKSDQLYVKCESPTDSIQTQKIKDETLSILYECKKEKLEEDEAVNSLCPAEKDKVFHKCQYCNESFDRFDLLNNHYNICAKKLSDKVESKPVETNFIEIETGPPIIEIKVNDSATDVCKIFNIDGLKLPPIYKRPERLFICEVCSKEFKQASNLKSHMVVHTGIKPYSCHICGKQFSQGTRLRKHMRVHTGEKPYKCDTCDRSFSQSHQLTGHRRIHTGEKPYGCKHCGKFFSQLGHLKVHIKRFLAKEQLDLDLTNTFSDIQNGPMLLSYLIKKYQIKLPPKEVPQEPKPRQIVSCPVCKKLFSQPWNLKLHMRVHIGGKPHVCEECGSSFAYAHSLKEHSKVHAGEQPIFYCDTCDKTFTRLRYLQRHSRIHVDGKLYRCDVCDKTFMQPKHLDLHKRMHVKKEFPCEKCDKSFDTDKQFERHMSTHNKTLACCDCDKVFKSKLGLMRHKLQHKKTTEDRSEKKRRKHKKKKSKRKHSSDREEKEIFCVDIKTEIKSEPEDVYEQSVDSFVDASFKNESDTDEEDNLTLNFTAQKLKIEKESLESTLAIKKEEESFDNDNDMNQFKDDAVLSSVLSANGDFAKQEPLENEDKKNIKLLTENISPIKNEMKQKTRSPKGCHVCKICKKIFPYRYTLKGHMRIHSNERPYVCDVCGKAFNFPHNLVNHKRIHTGERPYGCKYCGKKFRAIGHRQKHVKMHTGERSFACEVCGKLFTCMSNLKAHSRVHTGDRPYSCDTCDRSFTQICSLTKHKQVHVKTMSSLEIYNETYGKKYDEKSLAKKRPFECHLCKRSFCQLRHLTQHVNNHDRTFDCTVCTKVFKIRRYLKDHMKVHNKPALYPCTLCSYTSTMEGRFKTHMRNHEQLKVKKRL